MKCSMYLYRNEEYILVTHSESCIYDNEYHSWLSEFRWLYPNHDDDDEDNIERKCNVEMVDDNIAQLFGRSVKGKKEFPDAAVNQKCAI